MFKQAFTRVKAAFVDRTQTVSKNPIAPVTDDYSHPRGRTTIDPGQRHRRRLKALRRTRREMAFQSRRRNRYA